MNASPELGNASVASPPLSFTVNVLGQVSLGLLAMTLCLPSIPSWLVLFDATQGKVQLTYSAYLVTFALAQLIYGPLSDNYGRRRVLLAGLLIGLLGTVLAAMAPTLDLLIVARALQGAGTCAGMTIGRAMIQDSFVGPSRTRLMAWIGVVMGLCPPLGTLIGGQLHVRFGWRSTFVFMAVVIVLALIAAWRLPHDSKRGVVDRSVAQIAGSYRELLATPSFLSFCLIAAFSSATFLVFLGAAPTVFSALGVAPESIGWYILFIPGSYIAGNLVTTRIIGWLPDRTLMACGQGLSLAGIVLVLGLSLAGLYHPLAVAMPLMLVGLGHGLLMPPTLTGVVGSVPLLAGAAAAMAGMLQQLMGAVASYLSGLVDLGQAASMAGFMLAFTGLAIASQWRMVRSTYSPRAMLNDN